MGFSRSFGHRDYVKPTIPKTLEYTLMVIYYISLVDLIRFFLLWQYFSSDVDNVKEIRSY